jgi:hypothetical protein
MSLRRTVAVASATLLFASACGASPWVLKPGEFYSELNGSLFSARSFYRDDERLTLNGKLDEREVMSHNEFGWKKRASVWIGVPFVSRGFTRFTGGTSTSTGLGDLDLGIRYRLKGGETPAALSFGWTASTGTNRKLFPGSDGDGGTNPDRYPPASSSTPRTRASTSTRACRAFRSRWTSAATPGSTRTGPQAAITATATSSSSPAAATAAMPGSWEPTARSGGGSRSRCG